LLLCSQRALGTVSRPIPVDGLEDDATPVAGAGDSPPAYLAVVPAIVRTLTRTDEM
jgi:hypothetical protein